MGGIAAERSNIIDYVTINSTGNATDFGDLLNPTYALNSACSNKTNERATYGGGYTGVYTDVIQYVTINSTGNTTDFGDLLAAVGNSGSTSNT